MWQEIIVSLLILVALAYLGKRFFGKSKAKEGCDKCGKP
jgi:membrane protein implicated in regulation of membrane protease activity